MTAVQLGIDTEATFDAARQLSLTEAAKLLRGRGGKAPSVDTLRRWANPNRGCRVGELQLLLPTVRVGGEVLTMPEWVQAFAKMRARLGVRKVLPPVARPARQRAAAQRRATERLKAAGIG
jgi:hypothetical protein